MVFSATSAALKGFSPVRSQGGQERVNQYKIASAYGTSIFSGQPVFINTSGNVIVMGNDNDPVLGVFDGVWYAETDGNVVFRPYWPASTALQSGSVASASLVDVRDQSFIGLANADFAQSMAFEYADISALTGGSTVTGRSTITVDVGNVDDKGSLSANNTVQIIELSKRPGDLRSLIVQFIRPYYAAAVAA